MAVLSLNAADSCKYLSVIINYPVTVATNVTLEITNAAGTNIAGGINPTFNLTAGSGPINYPIAITDISVNYGIVIVQLKTTTGTDLGDPQAVLLHCDIDCCLTKLTNELIDCACDCAKCASSLAKAQKVFLLLQSANYAIVQANDAPDSSRPGYIQDANSKYLKAKEICDESCGCNC